MNALNRLQHGTLHDPEILTRIAQYEMAFKMQASVPDLVDMSKEPAAACWKPTAPSPGDGSFASNCLLARRLAERGVRFIQLYHRDWDHHGGVKANIAIKAQEIDRATAALISDLKQRGMLDDTLVIWGGEFGRTPMSQGGDGRDHHIKGFSYMLAGGGIKGRHQLTARPTNSAMRPQENPVSVPRFPCDDAAPAGHRSQAADGEVSGPGCPADRDLRRRRPRYFGLTLAPQLQMVYLGGACPCGDGYVLLGREPLNSLHFAAQAGARGLEAFAQLGPARNRRLQNGEHRWISARVAQFLEYLAARHKQATQFIRIVAA